MQIKLKSFSLITAILLTGFGCGGGNNSTPKNIAEFDDAKKLVNSLGSKRSNSTSSSYMVDSENFTIDSNYDYYQTPMIIGADGNLQKGGLLKFTDKKDREVIIEATDTNKVVIKIDLNNDGIFTEDEMIMDVYNPLPEGLDSEPRAKTIDDIISNNLKKTLNLQPEDEGYIHNDEKIEVKIFLEINGLIFPVDPDTISLSDEHLEEINRQNAMVDKLKKETLEAFIEKNNLTEDEYINQALEESSDSFVIALTKNEIREIAKTNLNTISAITYKNVDVGPIPVEPIGYL